MKNKETKKMRISAPTIIACVLSVIFACAAIFTANQMRSMSQNMYEHPYTVSNDARAMRSRLLDMKRFVGTFLIHDYVSAGTTKDLFQERYDIQTEAMDAIEERYLGPSSDVESLREAFDNLIQSQEEAVAFVPNHTEKEINDYIETSVYPRYDAVDRCLENIIYYTDNQILGLTQQSQHAANIFIVMSILLCLVIILLTIYSNHVEHKHITSLKKRENELEDALTLAQKASNAKKDFLSRMSHEIRTPMNVIIGMTTIASTRTEDPAKVSDCLTKIAYSSRHLLSLINDVLDMSKIEEGKMTANHTPFELSQLVESVTGATYSQCQSQNKTFECQVQGDVYDTYIGDFMRVNQILLNILSNAVKFTQKGDSISLTVSQLSEKDNRAFLRFVVSDTGIGMSKEFLDRIFQPFEQENAVASSKYGGTGLGMAITYNLVELLDGTIHVESTEGEGSTFTVDLPFDIPAELAPPKQWTLDELNILVVDDDADACAHASLLLKRMGIQANWVQSGHEAVQMVLDAYDKHEGFDVCLIDWQMPEMDGIEVTKKIREKLGPDTIIIILTAYDWSLIEEDARNAGANAFISKPLFESSLYNVLQSVYGRADIPTSNAATKETKESHVGAYKGKRFLLVEDNGLNCEIAVEMLADTGAEIEYATNGQEATDLFLASDEGYFDAILMDIQMPIMNGYDATKTIRSSKHPDAEKIPIFAMTANAFREDVEKCLNAGMNGHIAKPIDDTLLFKALDSI